MAADDGVAVSLDPAVADSVAVSAVGDEAARTAPEVQATSERLASARLSPPVMREVRFVMTTPIRSSEGESYLTIRTPCMLPWYVQWKGYVPGAEGAVNVADAPGPTFASKAPALSPVTVWPWASAFITVTVAPGATEAGVVYLKSLIVMVAAAAGTLVAALADSEEETEGAEAAGVD